VIKLLSEVLSDKVLLPHLDILFGRSHSA
jgi:hypothetical protein